MLSPSRIALFTAALVASSSVLLWAAKEFVPPKAADANTYSSKDAHPNEKVTVAIDVYNAPPRDDIFVTRYNQEGILPVFLVITNDGDQPITLKGMRAQLVTAGRAKLEALDVEDVFRRVAHIQGSSNPQTVGPITFPRGMKNKKAQQQLDEITRAHFAAELVEPHATRSGFLFFDVENVKQPVAARPSLPHRSARHEGHRADVLRNSAERGECSQSRRAMRSIRCVCSTRHTRDGYFESILANCRSPRRRRILEFRESPCLGC